VPWLAPAASGSARGAAPHACVGRASRAVSGSHAPFCSSGNPCVVRSGWRACRRARACRGLRGRVCTRALVCARLGCEGTHGLWRHTQCAYTSAARRRRRRRPSSQARTRARGGRAGGHRSAHGGPSRRGHRRRTRRASKCTPRKAHVELWRGGPALKAAHPPLQHLLLKAAIPFCGYTGEARCQAPACNLRAMVSCGHVRKCPKRGVREGREQVRHGTGRNPSKPPRLCRRNVPVREGLRAVGVRWLGDWCRRALPWEP
jgi:hypothetical protein